MEKDSKPYVPESESIDVMSAILSSVCMAEFVSGASFSWYLGRGVRSQWTRLLMLTDGTDVALALTHCGQLTVQCLHDSTPHSSHCRVVKMTSHHSAFYQLLAR